VSTGTGRLALGLASALVALFLAEIVLRALPGPQQEGGLRRLHRLRPDQPWLFDLMPGARTTLGISGDVVYEINADGYRGPLVAPEKPPGVFRVVVMGDSISFGFGVADGEGWVRQLEVLAAARQPVEVVNLGVGGYNPYNEVALFAHRGARYQPDLVLVQFCVNDLNDPTRHFDAQSRLQLGSIPVEAFPDPAEHRPAPAWLVRLLRPCRRLELCARVESAWVGWRAQSSSPEAVHATFGARDLSREAPRRWLAARYSELSARAEALGARFAVVAFPFPAQLEGRATGRLQRQLEALGRKEGWVVIDLLPAFRAAVATGVTPLFMDLWHPTAAGHRVAAEAVAEDLARRGWLPRPGEG
jgi:lysophospholipase L1-like esterase